MIVDPMYIGMPALLALIICIVCLFVWKRDDWAPTIFTFSLGVLVLCSFLFVMSPVDHGIVTRAPLEDIGPLVRVNNTYYDIEINNLGRDVEEGDTVTFKPSADGFILVSIIPKFPEPVDEK